MLLQNMVAVADVDDTLKDEIVEECTKHGQVRDCVIHIDRPRDGSAPDPNALAKVFVEFVESAGGSLGGRGVWWSRTLLLTIDPHPQLHSGR